MDKGPQKKGDGEQSCYGDKELCYRERDERLLLSFDFWGMGGSFMFR